MTWAQGIFWENKRSFMFSGSSWTTASALEPATRSFMSMIDFERKYMKAKVKTRTDFWASLCFRENKKKFNNRMPKPQAPRQLYLPRPHPMSSWKKQNKTNPNPQHFHSMTLPQIQPQGPREVHDFMSQAHPRQSPQSPSCSPDGVFYINPAILGHNAGSISFSLVLMNKCAI